MLWNNIQFSVHRPTLWWSVWKKCIPLFFISMLWYVLLHTSLSLSTSLLPQYLCSVSLFFKNFDITDSLSGRAHTQITAISITRKHSLHIWNSNERITTGTGLKEYYNIRSKQLYICCANASKIKLPHFRFVRRYIYYTHPYNLQDIYAI